MVQYKRKPVIYLDRPPISNRDAEIWVIKETDEIFLDYENYLHRLDYYRQRKFTCDITGHTGLTFFEAMESEMEETRGLDTSFPEALREPVLRKVQFSTISRIDELVNHVFSEFRQDFFPGEQVVVLSENGERLDGTVREKVQFSAIREPDGHLRPPVARYFLRLDADDGKSELLAEAAHLTRDRKVFTKQMLRSFLKHSITRESWSGAPWTVKESLAKDYKINTEVPRELQYEVRMAEKKLAAMRKAEAGDMFYSPHAHPSRSLDVKSRFPKLGGSMPNAGQPPGPGQYNLFQHNFQDGQHPAFGDPHDSRQMNNVPLTTRFHHYPGLQPITAKESTPMPPPPPPIKYPIDDLDIKPKEDGIQRPALKFFSDDTPLPEQFSSNVPTGVRMRSMGPLLEIWNTLNVHCEVFLLDSFTFDDFVDAMIFSSDAVPCELFVEVHCSILKQLVDEDGDIQVTLPDLPDDDDEDESEEESSHTPTPEPEPEEPPRRTTRSSFAKSEALKNERTPSVEEDGPIHRAAEMLAAKDWVDRLKERDFRNGGWETIMVGLLRQVSLNPREQQVCDDVLSHLAPVNMEPTQETAKAQYVTLDVNLRVAALEIACLLAVRTRAVRSFLEQCSEQMTELRKEKIDMQRKRKPLVEELRELDEQRKILLPENVPSTPPPETNGNASPEVVMVGLDEDDDEPADSDDDDEAPRRVLRRANDRLSERKRKREESLARKEKERREKAEASKAGKQSAQFKKLLRDIDKKKDAIKKCEDSITELDNDLREANCQRTKVLGRDRYCNRYYWFERNGMPFAGLPNSSTADKGYANGRIWVQGPDDMERTGFIDLDAKEMDQYVKTFGMTVPDRRALEEGDTRLLNAHQWGYIDDPDDIDKLIAWLDERGKRERALRKELTLWRDPIAEYMQKMTAHLAEIEKSTKGEDPTTRISTRTKTYVDLDTSSHPCLAWRNSYALRELGHLHSEPPKPKRGKKAAAAAEKRDEKSSKVPVGRSGKPLTRQGNRY